MRFIRWIIVTIGSTILATLAINAFDNAGDLSNSIVGSLILPGNENSGPCPKEMVYVSTSESGFCADRYEASPSEFCDIKDPQNKGQTDQNISDPECMAVSVQNVIPWRNIQRHQAEIACKRAGKRLLTAKEWYQAAVGVLDKNEGWNASDCNVNKKGADSPDPTGSRSSCVSPSGAYDMVGNLWEWVEETVYDGQFDNRPMPESGYVYGVDDKGVPVQTNMEAPESSFFNDYFWVNPADSRGIFRGGFWGNGSDAGQYSLNAMMPPTFSGNAVGFRCAK